MFKFTKKDIIYYTIIATVILILLSTFIHHTDLKFLVIFFLMSIIIFWLINDFYKSILISFVITVILYLTSNTNMIDVEGFDSDIKVDEIVKELTDLSKTANQLNERTDDKQSITVTKINDDKNNKIDKKTDDKTDDKTSEEITEEDISLLNDDTPSDKNKYMESAKAQRETFRLINTIKQLDDTVKHLAPTLKQGADIIDRFKKLKLIQDQ